MKAFIPSDSVIVGDRELKITRSFNFDRELDGEEINKLKSLPGQDIIAYGGSKFVSGLVKANLIDDYYLFINPTAIGKGKTIFGTLENKMPLQLVKGTAFPCGIVAMHYQPIKA